MTKVVEDDRARQAHPGRPVLYVLVASLILAGVYLVAMMGWSGVESPPATGQTQSQPASPATPGTPPANR